MINIHNRWKYATIMKRLVKNSSQNIYSSWFSMFQMLKLHANCLVYAHVAHARTRGRQSPAMLNTHACDRTANHKMHLWGARILHRQQAVNNVLRAAPTIHTDTVLHNLVSVANNGRVVDAKIPICRIYIYIYIYRSRSFALANTCFNWFWYLPQLIPKCFVCLRVIVCLVTGVTTKSIAIFSQPPQHKLYRNLKQSY